MKKKTYVVIGLGRFGSAVATELCRLGHEVLVIDGSEEHVQNIANQVTHAAAGDARDPAVLRALGVRNYDCAIVAAADDVGSSALVTMNLKEIGVKRVICKAQSHVHRKVLEKIGADLVVFPEYEMGMKRELNVRAKYKVNVIALRRNGDEHDLQMSPSADDVIGPGDVVVTLGRYEDIDLLHQL